METELEAKLQELIFSFLAGEITPERTLDFEEALQGLLREFGRCLLEEVFNAAEPEPDALPHDIKVTHQGFRRLNKKTPNRHVATVFGRITLWRTSYRPWEKQDDQGVRFPLEQQLGLVEKCTPLLAGRIARQMGEAGANQRSVVDWIEREHGIRIGQERLRDITHAVSDNIDQQRHELQVEQLLTWLQEAYDSPGPAKPVLSVGRDGLSICTQPLGIFERAATSTVTVYDRRGQRLGTVYLAQPPETRQQTLSNQLTRLVQDVLRGWDRAMPRLCYVTDAGEAEETYWFQTLSKMRDPR